LFVRRRRRLESLEEEYKKTAAGDGLGQVLAAISLRNACFGKFIGAGWEGGSMDAGNG
jgi:hypothetical protein